MVTSNYYQNLNLTKLTFTSSIYDDFYSIIYSINRKKEIRYKLDIYPYYGSDASAAMSAGAEVKHAFLGAGIESSHSYERTHLDSVEATHRMVDAYLQSDLVK